MKYDDALFIKKISYDEFLSKNLQIMDQTAISMAKDKNLVIKVVNFSKKNVLKDVID
jgi:uridylate kinase